jgi:hypothetical protein
MKALGGKQLERCRHDVALVFFDSILGDFGHGR